MSSWILRSAPDSDVKGLAFRVRPGAVKTIGRAGGADFIIDVPLVSRVHCRLTATPSGLEVEDLQSTNGTFINERRVRRAVLKSGDRLRLGQVELMVEWADTPAGSGKTPSPP